MLKRLPDRPKGMYFAQSILPTVLGWHATRLVNEQGQTVIKKHRWNQTVPGRGHYEAEYFKEVGDDS
jgi:hypothetical protein